MSTDDPASKTQEHTITEYYDFHFAPEIEEGNVEYKRSLVSPSPERLEQLTSQLKWRLREGNGEALYEIGLDDNGFPRGLSDEDLARSIKNLTVMASNLMCEVSCVCMRQGKNGKIAEMLVREVREDKYIDLRVAVCGNVDSGKSTLVGVLTTGHLDNGRGAARVHVFNHKHELETGRTSSIGEQILGFDAKGKCTNYSELHQLSWGDIIENSYKVVSFFDLAGHEKYLKTTVSGMTGGMPDYCFLLIGANMGVTRMTKEHLGLALALKIPVVVLITKVDMSPENIKKETILEITRILKMRGVRKMPLLINSDEDLMSAVKTIQNDHVVPIFEVSSVSGLGLDKIRQFLNIVPPRIQWDVLLEHPPEVTIDQSYFVQGVGTVVGGTVMGGRVQEGDTLLLGPDGFGNFRPVMVKSIHAKRVPVREVRAGNSAGFALKKVKRSEIRRGMVLIHPTGNPRPVWEFSANVVILYHSTTIHQNYQPVVQCVSARQAAKIVGIDGKEVLRTGDRSLVRFRFMYHPEYIKPGMRIIFREGRCKGIGVVAATDFGSNVQSTTSQSGGEKKQDEKKSVSVNGAKQNCA